MPLTGVGKVFSRSCAGTPRAGVAQALAPLADQGIRAG
jgi:hypothetical protein